MKTNVRVTAAALILLAAITGCERSTSGTVAMTTEPGPPLTSPTRTPSTALPEFPGLPIPSIPLPPRTTDLPEVPPPPNATTMTCGEFNDLDEATQLAAIRAILAEQDNPLGRDNEMVAMIMAHAMCQFMPDATVSEVLLGG